MSFYKIVPWSEELNLSEFYKEADKRGFENNSSKHMLIDSLSKERAWAVWILYFKDKPVGSVGAHSFDDVMGPNSYRIAVRTCVFTDQLDGPYSTALRTISVITKHQNPTAQFLIPTCIDWCPKRANLYITSNESKVGTQRKVHNIFGPAMEKQNVMKKVKDVFYRGTLQSVWKFDADVFLNQLSKVPRWN
jgi:hypothetical protein